MEAVITLDSHLRAAAADYPRITQRLPQGKSLATLGLTQVVGGTKYLVVWFSFTAAVLAGAASAEERATLIKKSHTC